MNPDFERGPSQHVAVGRQTRAAGSLDPQWPPKGSMGRGTPQLAEPVTAARCCAQGLFTATALGRGHLCLPFWR